MFKKFKIGDLVQLKNYASTYYVFGYNGEYVNVFGNSKDYRENEFILLKKGTPESLIKVRESFKHYYRTNEGLYKNKFNIGDKIKCIFDGGYDTIKVGECYEVKDIMGEGVLIENHEIFYSHDFFVKMTQQTKAFEIGDEIILRNNYAFLYKGEKGKIIEKYYDTLFIVEINNRSGTFIVPNSYLSANSIVTESSSEEETLEAYPIETLEKQKDDLLEHLMLKISRQDWYGVWNTAIYLQRLQDRMESSK